MRGSGIKHNNGGKGGAKPAENKKAEPGRPGNIILRHLIFAAAFIACMLALHFSGIACPIRFITSEPCPACGVTRSLLALLRLDFAAAAYYNPASPLIAVLLLCGLHHNALKLNSGAMTAFYVLGLICVLASYLIRRCLMLAV
ncbi:MAG: DUF2752 domain-containing protein [Firmicutes bacterium]|nr:DUF2752 domain-containing protein [Bacillota bacterium]